MFDVASIDATEGSRGPTRRAVVPPFAQERHGAGCRRFVPGQQQELTRSTAKASSRCSALRANRCYGNPPKSQGNENNDDDVADRHALHLEGKRCCENRRYPPGLHRTKSPRAVRRRKRASINELNSASHVPGSRLQSRWTWARVRHSPGISRNSARTCQIRRSLTSSTVDVEAPREIAPVHDGGSLAGNESFNT